MDALVRAEGIEYHAIAQGALYVHRDPRQLDAGIKKMALLAEHGQRQEVLDPGAVARLDPVFAPVQGRSRARSATSAIPAATRGSSSRASPAGARSRSASR